MLEAVLVMVIKAERNKFCGTQTPATALESVFFYVYICIVSFFILNAYHSHVLDETFFAYSWEMH